MLKRILLVVVCAVVLGASMAGAQQQPPPPPKPSEAQATPVPPPPPPPRAFGQPVTIRIDLTVTDQVGTAPPVKKTMTLLAADGERASVRSLNRAPSSASPTANFNVDARPTLAQDKIRLDLGVYYDPPPLLIADVGSDKPVPLTTNIQESMGLIVENGKPLIVSQSADPRTDRKVTVEVKATILK